MPASHKRKETITAVILAGGGGRRMGGEDKGLLQLHGRALVQHVLERVEPQCDTILININRNRDAYARFGHSLLEDTLPGGLGPLAGLLTALEQSRGDYVISVPCDTPYLPADLVARMFESLQRNGADACTVDDGERLHPVIMLVRRSLAGDLRQYLESGGRKVHDWLNRIDHCTVDFSDQPEAFMNINTPEQLNTQEQGSFDFPRPILGFVASSGTGKTTLLEQLIPLLRERGVRVALLKHAHHDFDIDIPGKDSYRLRQAGASQVMIASKWRWALINENREQRDEPQLAELLQHLDPEQFDLLLVEGFKHEAYPKIELQRQSLGKPALYPDDPHIIALASDAPALQGMLTLLDINQPEVICEFIIRWLAQQPRAKKR